MSVSSESELSVKLCHGFNEQHVASLMDLNNLITNNAYERNVHTTFVSVTSTDSNAGRIAATKKFFCPKCKMTFAREHNVRRHISKVHALEAKDLLVTIPKREAYKYKCEHCKRQFNKRGHYNYHKRKVHLENIPRRECEEISCPECHETYQKKDIFSHYKQDHDVELKTETLQFHTFEEFNVWKEDVSVTSGSKFNLQRTKKTMDFTFYHFTCHRSGFFKSKGKGLRRLKMKGSTKIDSLCPSKIKVKQDTNGECQVEYQSTHFGHEIDINYLPLSHAERQSIVEKIAAKLPPDVILDEVKKSVFNSGLSRLHRVTKKDVHNIAASYYKKCKDDDNKKILACKLKEIHERHESSLNFQAKILKHGELWVLQSGALNELCTIKENLLDCSCELICANCKACMHKYSCSCIDSSVDLNMCKHIHFLCQYKDLESSEITYIMLDVVEQDLQWDESNYQEEVVISESNYDCTDFESCLVSRKASLIENYSKLINDLSSREELDLIEKNLKLLKATLSLTEVTEISQ